MPVFWVYEPSDSPQIYKLVGHVAAKSGSEAVFRLKHGDRGCMALLRKHLLDAGFSTRKKLCPQSLRITGGALGEPIRIVPLSDAAIAQKESS
jgi:hypothetical protein